MTDEGPRQRDQQPRGRQEPHALRRPPGLATGWGALLCLLALLAPGRGSAEPRPGETLPELSADDVTGQRQRLADLVQGPTLLVAISDRDAGDAMRSWFEAAARRAPQANQVSIISIGKPFFVSDAYARSRAREQVPPAHWHASLLDTDHAMAKELGLEIGEVTYAFAVSGGGQVVAAVRGKPDGEEAEQLWGALNRLLGAAPASPPRRGSTSRPSPTSAPLRDALGT